MNRPRSRHLSRLLLVLAAVAVSTLGLIAPATAAAPYCGLTWGSLPQAHDTHADTEAVYGVRAGRHACYDRLVIDLGGQDISFGSYDVRYVPRIISDGSGAVVPVRGGAALQVIVRAPAYDEHGPTYLPANPREVVAVSGFSTFRQVAWAGSFEGQTTLGVGVRARLPFRVLTVTGTPDSDNGPKLVIDVAHRW
jgi:hypothetical protein